jgi:light-regulated signal transduction histidine kinase (bacteriophytochrome)
MLIMETWGPATQRPFGEPVDLAQLVSQTVEELDAVIKDHQLSFIGYGECSIWGDSHALRHLVTMLIMHGAANSAPGRDIDVQVWCYGEVVCLTVEDEGWGEPPAQADRLFRPFTRADGEASQGSSLMPMKRIADAHSATLAVQGTRGQGMTFEVSFPNSRHGGKPEVLN